MNTKWLRVYQLFSFMIVDLTGAVAHSHCPEPQDSIISQIARAGKDKNLEVWFTGCILHSHHNEVKKLCQTIVSQRPSDIIQYC